LAFGELSSLKTHFRPFTEVMRKSRREVTRELGERAWIARILRMSQTTLAESLLLKRRRIPRPRCVVMGELLIERDRAHGSILLPVGAKRRRSNNCTTPRLIQIQKYGGVRLRSRQEPIGHANWLQKLCFALLPCVPMCSRHSAIPDTAARPSQGRRSRKVTIIVPPS
jgi:hypothetical protein